MENLAVAEREILSGQYKEEAKALTRELEGYELDQSMIETSLRRDRCQRLSESILIPSRQNIKWLYEGVATLALDLLYINAVLDEDKENAVMVLNRDLRERMLNELWLEVQTRRF